jgi:hypothetical protein
MRQFFGKRFLAVLAVAVLGLAAAAFAFTAGGRAAGNAICGDSHCVVETLAPHSLAAGATGVSLTKFTNESGVGGATATHTAITVTFSAPVTVGAGAIQLFVNGVLQSAGSCTQTTSTTVSCPDFVSTFGGTSDKVVIQYSPTTTGALNVTGSVTFGEGNGNTGGPTNDSFSSTDTVQVFAAGDATNPLFQSTCKSDNSSGSLGGADTQVGASIAFVNGVTTQNSANGFLPCTPASAGVIPGSKGVNTEISVVDFPPQAAPSTNCVTITVNNTQQTFCYVVGILKFFFPPKNENQNTFSLFEGLGPVGLVNGVLGFPNGSITVPPCNANGLPPNAGAPATLTQNDSCVFSRGSLPKGGVQLGVHLLSNPKDQNFGG